MTGSRGNQIDLINYLLGGQNSPGGTNAGNAFGNLQQYFGNLGVPQSDLQRQSAGGLSNMLSNESPYSKTMNSAYGSLQEILNPGSMNPQLNQDLSMANQQGSRFGSANEILRGQAMTGLFNLRNQAAGTLGALGQSQANVLGQGYGVGQAQANQGDIGLQRMLSLFGGLLGLRQQSTQDVPITQTPNWMQSLGGGIQGMLPFLGGRSTPQQSSGFQTTPLSPGAGNPGLIPIP